jgi:hypothetical protein
MLEINQLYRVIARDDAALTAQMETAGLLVLAFLSGLLVLFFIWRPRRQA